MNTNDIEGTKPQCVKFQTKRIGNNPLNPTYTVSHVERRPYTPPRYIRDAMNIDDIDKARPREDKHQKIKTKTIMEIGDIEGTKSRPRVYTRPRNASFSNIDYTDVTKTVVASKR